VKIYVAAVEALRKKERQDETQFTTKIGGKTSLGPRYLGFIKFSFAVMQLMPYYVETGALWITLIIQNICNLEFLLNFWNHEKESSIARPYGLTWHITQHNVQGLTIPSYVTGL
jgi:hypothetical protein